MPSLYTSRTSWEEIERAPTFPILKGCSREYVLKGCLAIPTILVSLYIISISIAFINFCVNEAKWKANKITSYSVVIRYGIESGHFYSSFEEIVRDGKLVKGENVQPAIDYAFDEARSCIFIPALCRVEYNALYGYPMSIHKVDFDLGRVIELVDFSPTIKAI
ncbi:MAG: hypothetical protein HZC41_21620 [Chloroflexi bacterium]|nr:hypothetical protein [Chloroflexota bacterium]